MGRQSISRKAWQRAVNVLLWYPTSKTEYEALLEELMTKHPPSDGKPLHPDPTADLAILLAENKRLQTLKSEIDAVEAAITYLRSGEEDIVRRRFWETPAYRPHSPRQYDFLQDLPFSYRHMRRVCRRVILVVAELLGEE